MTTDQQCSDIAEGSDGSLWFACNEGMLRHAGGRWTRMQSGRKQPAVRLQRRRRWVATAACGSAPTSRAFFSRRPWRSAGSSMHVRDRWLDDIAGLLRPARITAAGYGWAAAAAWTFSTDSAGPTCRATMACCGTRPTRTPFSKISDGSVWIGSPVGVSHILKPEAIDAPKPAAGRHHLGDARCGMRWPMAERARRRQSGAAYRALFAAGRFVRRYARVTATGCRDSDWIETPRTSSTSPACRRTTTGWRSRPSTTITARCRLPARSNFSIPPPWWRAWWAILADAGAVLLLVIGSAGAGIRADCCATTAGWRRWWPGARPSSPRKSTRWNRLVPSSITRPRTTA